jgi:hypothetical protein
MDADQTAATVVRLRAQTGHLIGSEVLPGHSLKAEDSFESAYSFCQTGKIVIGHVLDLSLVVLRAMRV